jgi:HD-like signal output (HDOD) protein
MFSKITDLMNDIFKTYGESEIPLYKVELETIGFDHAALGGQLLKSWKFPANLQEAVQFHHNPKGSIMSKLEASAVNIADLIAHGMQLGTSGERFIPPFQADVWESLDLQPDLLKSVGSKVEDQFDATVQMFLQK